MSDKKNNSDKPKVAISRRALGGEAPIIVNEITDRCLYTAFFGNLDSARMKKVIDSVIKTADSKENDLIIVDLSNVEVIDSAIANHIKNLNKLLLLIGLKVIFCGILPIVAQSMISAGVELDNITVEKNLKRALKLALHMQGLKLVQIDG